MSASSSVMHTHPSHSLRRIHLSTTSVFRRRSAAASGSAAAARTLPFFLFILCARTTTTSTTATTTILNIWTCTTRPRPRGVQCAPRHDLLQSLDLALCQCASRTLPLTVAYGPVGSELHGLPAAASAGEDASSLLLYVQIPLATPLVVIPVIATGCMATLG